MSYKMADELLLCRITVSMTSWWIVMHTGVGHRAAWRWSFNWQPGISRHWYSQPRRRRTLLLFRLLTAQRPPNWLSNLGRRQRLAMALLMQENYGIAEMFDHLLRVAVNFVSLNWLKHKLYKPTEWIY